MQGQPKLEFDSKSGIVTSVKETLLEECQEFIMIKKGRSLKKSCMKDNIIENNNPFAFTPLL